MTSSPSVADTPQIDVPPAAVTHAADTGPKLVVTHGRGGTGKSTFVRLMFERAQRVGRPPVLADADRTNATLQAFFKGVVRPEYSDEKTVQDWLDAVVNQQAADKVTVILDMGGGDQVFKRFAMELQLAELLESAGILPVALHFIGPDLDDLSYLNDIEQSHAFCPAATALILNEGLIKDGRPKEAAFSEVRAHPIFQAAIERGARDVWLPRLGCMQELINRRLSFETAEKAVLGLTNRQRVALWRRAVEQALQPISEWLP